MGGDGWVLDRYFGLDNPAILIIYQYILCANQKGGNIE